MASSSKSENEEKVKLQLQDLQKQLGKKQLFEDAVSCIDSLLLEIYPSASPSLRKVFYSVISRVATILKTRYTAPGFWVKGMQLFGHAEKLASDPSEKQHLKSCITKAREHLHDVEIKPEVPEPSRGYLFEGHLTVDREPPQPSWLVQSNLLSSVAASMANEPVQNEVENSNTSENITNLLQGLIETMDNIVPELFDDGTSAPRVPPASKEVVANLPIITLTGEILNKLGEDAECAICKENLLVGDKMQELPCKHTYHPPCLKPWLDEHNSCPVCRHELKTDDHSYESWKEREKEAEEERKGAANAVHGGEYMYV